MTDHRREPGCYSCDHEAPAEWPPREAIWTSSRWRVTHAFDTSLPEWLVVVPRRHVTAFADLDDAEAAELGPLLVALGRALGQVVGCVKTYVMQFAEAEGHGHVHFHIVPRMADQPAERRSMGIFGYLGVPEEERVSEERMNEVAKRVREYL